MELDDALDERSLLDGGHDLQLAAAVWAVAIGGSVQ
jgi:hypothetical protein